jgi:Flp pilus assembly pilin Flp
MPIAVLAAKAAASLPSSSAKLPGRSVVSGVLCFPVGICVSVVTAGLKLAGHLVDGPSMNFVLSLFARLTSERGQTMAEYGVVVVWIALVVIVGATTLGHALESLFHSTASKV